jgi:hypothetical protein
MSSRQDGTSLNVGREKANITNLRIALPIPFGIGSVPTYN